MPSRRVAGDTVLYPGLLRAQVTWHTASGLPRDNVVNTFHFQGAMSDANVDAIADLLHHFYNDSPGSGVPAVAHYLSSRVTYPELRVYDLGETDPRTPHHPSDGSGWDSNWQMTGSGQMPNEVAVCLSYYTDKNAPRKRGRIYIGPLSTNAMAGEYVGGDIAPNVLLVSVLAQSAGTLAHQLTHPGLSWVLLSPKSGGSAGHIQHGWVDNAFDTIRKRGAKATQRTTF